MGIHKFPDEIFRDVINYPENIEDWIKLKKMN
jgi:hypothetical protein